MPDGTGGGATWGGRAARRLVVAVLAASVLAGSGCSADKPAPKSASEEEATEYAQRNLDVIWGLTNVPDGTPRPQVERVRFVKAKEWAEVTSECMNRAGYPQYRANDGEVISNAPQDGGSESDSATDVGRPGFEFPGQLVE